MDVILKLQVKSHSVSVIWPVQLCMQSSIANICVPRDSHYVTIQAQKLDQDRHTSLQISSNVEAVVLVDSTPEVISRRQNHVTITSYTHTFVSVVTDPSQDVSIHSQYRNLSIQFIFFLIAVLACQRRIAVYNFGVGNEFCVLLYSLYRLCRPLLLCSTILMVNKDYHYL